MEEGGEGRRGEGAAAARLQALSPPPTHRAVGRPGKLI